MIRAPVSKILATMQKISEPATGTVLTEPVREIKRMALFAMVAVRAVDMDF